MNKHIISTWTFANMLYPFVLIFIFQGGDSVSLFGFCLEFIIWSFVLSLPSLAISLLAGYFISSARGSATIKFIIWLITAPVIVLLNFIIMAIAFDDRHFDFFGWEMAAPAIISVVAVILIRYQSFFEYFNQIKKDETTMV